MAQTKTTKPEPLFKLPRQGRDGPTLWANSALRAALEGDAIANAGLEEDDMSDEVLAIAQRVADAAVASGIVAVPAGSTLKAVRARFNPKGQLRFVADDGSFSGGSGSVKRTLGIKLD